MAAIWKRAFIFVTLVGPTSTALAWAILLNFASFGLELLRISSVKICKNIFIHFVATNIIAKSLPRARGGGGRGVLNKV